MGHGGKLLVDCLVALGAKKAFGVPGESYLPVLDAMLDTHGQFDYVLCRQEGGAAFMASAWGKLTGTPGICMVTRGPGATNAAIGVHTAMQDSSPMILFVGQVGTGMKGREAFQELDYRAVFGTMAKWVTEIDRVERIPELVARAWTTALSGRPGPVVVALPEDVLSAEADVAPLAGPARIVQPAADPATVDAALDLIAGGEAAAGADRRQRLVGRGARGVSELRRNLEPAGSRRLPFPGPVRQSFPFLRWRGRGGDAAACEAPDVGGGPDSRGEYPLRRDDDRRLSVARRAGSAAEADPCAWLCGGAGQSLPADAGDRLGRGKLRHRAAPGAGRLGGLGAGGAGRLRGELRSAAAAARAGHGGGDELPARHAGRGCDRDQWRGQFLDLEQQVFPLWAEAAAACAAIRGDGLRRCPQLSRRGWPIPAGRWSALPATAISR